MTDKRFDLCKMKIAFLAFILAVLVTGAAEASTIVWDWSPQTTGGSVTSDNWSNDNPGQHFAEAVQFGYNVAVNGIDIYNSSSFGSVGQAVVVTIWQDASGQPGSVLGRFSTTIAAIDSDGAVSGNTRKHADFSDFTMLAGTIYWIGMAGDYTTLTQTGLLNVSGGDSMMAQFNWNDTFSHFTDTSVGDMAFRLYGDRSSVPEPSTMLLFGLSLMGLAGFRRKMKP